MSRRDDELWLRPRTSDTSPRPREIVVASQLPPEERLRRAEREIESALIEMRAEYEAARTATEGMRQELVGTEFRLRALQVRSERARRPRHILPREVSGPRARVRDGEDSALSGPTMGCVSEKQGCDR